MRATVAGPRPEREGNMLVAAIISVSTAAIVVLAAVLVVSILLAVRARSAPRRRRRQTETAARLFDDGAISAWSNTDSEEWTDDQRDAALVYYNTAGRRARIGGIRADLIPDNHRNHIKRLTDSIGDDDASQAIWSDLLWLAARLDRQGSTSRSAAPQADAETTASSEQRSDDRAKVNNLATVLGLNGSTVNMGEMEQAGEREAPLATPKSAGTGDSGDVRDNPNGENGPDAEQRPDQVGSISKDTPDARPTEPNADTDDGDRSQLPDVPAWILEARAALPKPQTAAESGVKPTRIGASADTKPILAGTDFPWPHKAASVERVTTVPDVPEPIDFIPDVDSGQLTITDDKQTAESEPAPARAGAQQIVENGGTEQHVEPSPPTNGKDETESATTGDSVARETGTASANANAPERSDKRVEAREASTDTDTDVEAVAMLDEIHRLKRKAKKATAKSEKSRLLTVKYAREGRRKRARVAANASFDHAELAKRLTKRARRLEQSLKQ